MEDQAIGTEITVNYRGKPVKGKLVAPGVVQRCTRKGAQSYLVQCSVSGEWCYCSQPRMTKLRAKYGSKGTRAQVAAGYVSNAAKRQIKANEKAAKDAAKALKAVEKEQALLDADLEDDEGGLELTRSEAVAEIELSGDEAAAPADEQVNV